MNRRLRLSTAILAFAMALGFGVSAQAQAFGVSSDDNRLAGSVGVPGAREVLRGVLYRGASGNGRAPMTSSSLKALCDNGVDHAVYLYNKGFNGASTTTCGAGKLEYDYIHWKDSGLGKNHKLIYSAIKSGKKVFIHCWYGIHATGYVAATALMQFCDMKAETAVSYWKQGIAPKLQYPEVIAKIRGFKPNPSLTISSSEKSAICPN